MNIDLHIERLILDGLPVAEDHSSIVKTAVEAELSRLFQKSGISAEFKSGGAFSSMPRSSIALVPGSNSSFIGRQIAKAVYGGMGGSNEIA